MASTDEQIAELRAVVDALTARVEALEAFPAQLAQAFQEQLVPQAQDVQPGVSGTGRCVVFGDASTAGGV